MPTQRLIVTHNATHKVVDGSYIFPTNDEQVVGIGVDRNGQNKVVNATIVGPDGDKLLVDHFGVKHSVKLDVERENSGGVVDPGIPEMPIPEP